MSLIQSLVLAIAGFVINTDRKNVFERSKGQPIDDESYSGNLSGCPPIKFDKNKSLHKAYFGSAIVSVLLMDPFPSVSEAMTSLVMPFVYLALSDAALAGSKRLSSGTYKTLNCVALLVSSLPLYTSFSQRIVTGNRFMSMVSFVFNVVVIARLVEVGAASYGLIAGFMYKPTKDPSALAPLE